MASSHEGDRQVARRRRTMPALLGAAAIAVLSFVAVGASSASTDTPNDDATTDTVIVECRTGVVTTGDVSMSAMSVTRTDAAPASVPPGCRVSS